MTDPTIAAAEPVAPLAFLGADLADGRGVGDYARGLAAAIEQTGSRCLLLDRGTQSLAEFAATTPARLDAAGADWVFLQFVCYGWARRGILGRAEIEALRAVCANRRVAVFCHELWIGLARGESLKHRFIGALQRHGVLGCLRAIQPRLVLTSNDTYRAVLAAEGVPAGVLPLPGNLTQPTPADVAAAGHWLAEKGLPSGQAAGPLLVGVFGTIHPEWDGAAALAGLLAHARDVGRSVVLLTLGRHGPAGVDRLARLQPLVASGLRVISSGAMEAGLLAGLLSRLDGALATTPWALIGKSGTVAAFVDFGIPTLVTRDEWQWRGGPTPTPVVDPLVELFPVSKTHFDWARWLARRRSPAPRQAAIAHDLLSLLRHAPR